MYIIYEKSSLKLQLQQKLARREAIKAQAKRQVTPKVIDVEEYNKSQLIIATSFESINQSLNHHKCQS